MKNIKKVKTLVLLVAAPLAAALNASPQAQDKPAVDPNRPVSVFVLDTGNNGFQLSPPDEGVRFDIDGTGTPLKIGWTKIGADDAFFFLDTNGNGKVDSGRELLGDGWRRPSGSRVRDGLDALVAIQGIPERTPGSPTPQGTGTIDANDEVFTKLRLWFDADRNGESAPEELETLDRLRIMRISLGFGNLNGMNVGEAGNRFLLSGVVYLTPLPGTVTEIQRRAGYSNDTRKFMCVQFARKATPTLTQSSDRP